MNNTMFEEDANNPEVSGTLLNQLSNLVKNLKDEERNVVCWEIELEEAKKRRNRISQELIPSLMNELGFSKVTLESGEVIAIERAVYANISKDRADTCHRWMRENGFGSLVKHEFIIPVPNEESSVKLVKVLFENEIDFIDKESVHAATLKKFIKDTWVEPESEGIPKPPQELFGVFIRNEAKITKKGK